MASTTSHPPMEIALKPSMVGLDFSNGQALQVASSPAWKTPA